MCFFRKKKSEREKLLENKHQVEDMASSIDVLLSIGAENEELCGILKEVQDKIKYFNPSVNEDVLLLDKKISNVLGDLKIEINKAKSKEDYSKAIETAKDIQISLIVERISKSNRKK